MANRISDVTAIKPQIGSPYPAPFFEPCAARERQALGDSVGLTQFGVNRLTLPPGCWSSQRHWHSLEDEFVMLLEGEVTLVTDDGETVLTPGMFAGFPADLHNGHHFINKGDVSAVLIEVGGRQERDVVHYADIDMVKGDSDYFHRDGTPYPRRTEK